MTGLDPHGVGLELRLARVGRENVETKARRYLVEGRLTIVRVEGGRIDATCRGTEETHRLGFERGDWYCTCPARARCSHLVALQLLIPRPGTQGARRRA